MGASRRCWSRLQTSGPACGRTRLTPGRAKKGTAGRGHASILTAIDTDGETRDLIARCVIAGGIARVVVVVATDAVREAAERHHASPAATVALGRGAMAGLLLATLTKDDERVSVQILGDGPLGTLTVDASSSGTVRAFVRHPHAGSSAPPRPRAPSSGSAETATGPGLPAWVGRAGTVSVVRDLKLGQPFTGQTSLGTGEIDEDVERYLLDSEQVDSALGCEVMLDAGGEARLAVGVLVQALPNSEGSNLVEAARERLRAGGLVMALHAVMAAGTAGTPDAEALACAVVGEQTPDFRVLELRPVRFHCPCSHERAMSTLTLLGEAELGEMIATDGRADVTCDFCRREYQFIAEDLETIRAGLKHPRFN
jgi:molecular chaperone Hsp33